MNKICFKAIPFFLAGIFVTSTTFAGEACEATANLINGKIIIPCLNVIQEIECSDKNPPDENGVCSITTPYNIIMDQRGSVLDWEVTFAIEEFNTTEDQNTNIDADKTPEGDEDGADDGDKTQDDDSNNETEDDNVTEDENEEEVEDGDSTDDDSGVEDDPVEEEEEVEEENNDDA